MKRANWFKRLLATNRKKMKPHYPHRVRGQRELPIGTYRDKVLAMLQDGGQSEQAAYPPAPA